MAGDTRSESWQHHQHTGPGNTALQRIIQHKKHKVQSRSELRFVLVWTWQKPPHAHSEEGMEATERETTQHAFHRHPQCRLAMHGIGVGVGSVNVLLMWEC